MGDPFLIKNIHISHAWNKIRIKSRGKKSSNFLFQDVSKLPNKKPKMQNENKANSSQFELELCLSLAIGTNKHRASVGYFCPIPKKNIHIPHTWNKIRMKSRAKRSSKLLVWEVGQLLSKKSKMQNENKANSVQLELELYLRLAMTQTS